MGKHAGIILFFLCLQYILQGQNYNYVQYTTRDGLAGNMVYDMCQDRDGFLWFGTENGLSRFDGKSFKNFSVKDGLPDNEVLGLFPDSKGRVWLVSFSYELSYYLNGRIYNRNNDSILKKFKSNSRPTFLWEGSDSTIWILCQSDIFYLLKNGDLKEVRFSPSLATRSLNPYLSIYRDPESAFPFICFNDSAFRYKNGQYSFFKKSLTKLTFQNLFGLSSNPRPIKSKINRDIIHMTWKDNAPFLIGTVAGAVEMSGDTLEVVDTYLPDKNVPTALVDKEGIYWFGTLGEGVFKLPSKSALTSTVYSSLNASNEVFCIATSGDSILTGHVGGTLVVWQKKAGPKLYSFKKYLPKVQNGIATNRLRSILPAGNGNWLLGFDGFLLLWGGENEKMIPFNGTKTMHLMNENELIVATGTGVFKVSIPAFRITDTVWNARATVAVSIKQDIFIGTLNGLFELKKDGIVKNWGNNHSSLKRRITDLKYTGKSLWVATSDSGVVEIENNGKIGRAFSEKDGLSSNICRSLFLEGYNLWVGTNKGLNKVNLLEPDLPVIKYNAFNLLPNDGISALNIRGKEILVGSPAGLTIFQEELVNAESVCSVVIDNIEGSNRKWKSTDRIELPFQNNGLNIDFSGISMKSAGEMVFHYKIEGLENIWTTTIGNRISIAVLPPGQHRFKIYAVNKFGVKSKEVGFNILVNTPFWRTYWFLGLMLVIVTGLVYQLIKLRNSAIQNKMEEKNRIEKQLASLEQKALQAQMNPHFIFNALNSIQQYILENRVEDANRYLSIFATLIRETLENSSSGRISLNREIAYISKYLELERMRFGNSFEYRISLNGLKNQTQIEIPVMLLQPFVENAVRHGMRYRQGEGGLIEIDFSKSEDAIICHIKDNGPGRAARLQIKSKQPIEYQSKGMDLTQRRVDILNQVSEEQVFIDVRDVLNETGQVAGTDVVIKFTHLANETDD